MCFVPWKFEKHSQGIASNPEQKMGEIIQEECKELAQKVREILRFFYYKL